MMVAFFTEGVCSRVYFLTDVCTPHFLVQAQTWQSGHNHNKHNAELQQTDLGTKNMGGFSTGAVYPT